MAIRSRAVRPDALLDTALGPIPYVSDGAFYQAVADAAATVALAGGEFRVVVQRRPTEFANESVTVAALIEWRNHSEAKPQTEPHVETTVAAPGSTWDFDDAEIAEQINEPEPTAAAAPAAVPAREFVPDEDEDVTSIPAELR